MFEPRRDNLEERLASLAALAGTQISQAEFLQRLLVAVAAPAVVRGGGLWTLRNGRPVECSAAEGAEYRVWVANGGTSEGFSELRRESLTTGERRLIPCESGETATDDAHRGTLVHWPLRGTSGSELIELLFDPTSDESHRREVLQFLQQAEPQFAAILDRTRDEFRSLVSPPAEGDWDSFLLSMHSSLDPSAMAYAIANDGRRLVGCDRMCVLVHDGARLRLLSISGVDLPDRRSTVVKAIEAAAAAVVRAGVPFTYTDSQQESSARLSGEFATYADACQVRAAMVVPLDATEDGSDSRIVGAVIAEWFTRTDPEQFESRLERLSRHSALALQNAVRHSDVAWAQALLPVQWVRSLWLGGRRTWTTAALIALAVVTLLLVFVPAPLVVSARGELQPVVRRQIYSPTDGIVEQVLVKEDDRVAVDTQLLTMSNPTLDLEVQRVVGAIDTWSKKLTSIGVRRLDDGGRRNEPGLAERMSGDEAEVREELDSLRQQLALLEKKRSLLTVKSPIAGRVVTWNVREDLAQRPVREGEQLLTVADPNSGWMLDLRLDERDAGDVVAALADSPDGLDVEFLLASRADETHRARLERISSAVYWDRDAPGERISAPATAAVTSSGFDEERCGTSVLARIACGRRSLGYVWFHDFYEALVRLVWY